jgi:hypothetical protein
VLIGKYGHEYEKTRLIECQETENWWNAWKGIQKKDSKINQWDSREYKQVIQQKFKNQFMIWMRHLSKW